MDYRYLLKKYMALVVDSESVTYLDDWDMYDRLRMRLSLTKEDMEALRLIEAEIYDEQG